MKHTMTVDELIAELKKYPANSPVFATWESVLAPILPENFTLEPAANDTDLGSLVIDVEGH